MADLIIACVFIALGVAALANILWVSIPQNTRRRLLPIMSQSATGLFFGLTIGALVLGRWWWFLYALGFIISGAGWLAYELQRRADRSADRVVADLIRSRAREN